jgi:benzoyl-CoA reductase/2-hydroxyglutaryl-CoA dehydratase subunit BcrC/BadD/HgdB
MSTPRKKLKLEHDEDLFLFDLSERFHSFCYPQMDDDSPSISLDDLYQRLNEHDLQYRSSINLNFQNLNQEIVTNEEKLFLLNSSIKQIKQSINERKKFLKLAKLKRRHQSDYLTMFNVINRYPSRDILQKKFNQLNLEYEQQKSELTHLNQRLISYQKQSKVVLYSLLELVGFIDVKLPINFEDEIGRLDNNHSSENNGEK